MPRHIPFYNDESGVSILNLRAPKGIDVESWFIECYKKHKGHPMQILLGLYKGNYHKFFLAVIFFFIKHAPVWVLPIVTANIINDITSGSPETYQNIIIQAMIMIVLVALNVPMNYMYTRYKSLATRYAETATGVLDQNYGGTLDMVFDEDGNATMEQGGGNLTGTYEYVDEYTLLVSLDNSGSTLNYACAFAEDEDGVTMVLMNR